MWFEIIMVYLHILKSFTLMLLTSGVLRLRRKWRNCMIWKAAQPSVPQTRCGRLRWNSFATPTRWRSPRAAVSTRTVQHVQQCLSIFGACDQGTNRHSTALKPESSLGFYFTKQVPPYGHRNPHYKPKTVWYPSQVYNGNPFTNKTVSS